MTPKEAQHAIAADLVCSAIEDRIFGPGTVNAGVSVGLMLAFTYPEYARALYQAHAPEIVAQLTQALAIQVERYPIRMETPPCTDAARTGEDR